MFYFGLLLIFLSVFGLFILEWYDCAFYKYHARRALGQGEEFTEQDQKTSEQKCMDEFLRVRSAQSKFKLKLAILSEALIITFGLLNYYAPVLLNFYQSIFNV